MASRLRLPRCGTDWSISQDDLLAWLTLHAGSVFTPAPPSVLVEERLADNLPVELRYHSPRSS